MGSNGKENVGVQSTCVTIQGFNGNKTGYQNKKFRI